MQRVSSNSKFRSSEEDLGEIKVVPAPAKLNLNSQKPRDAPENADKMIDKFSSSHGIDKKFWLDFENTVLKEIRTKVEEIDPIDWLMSLADSNTGYNVPTTTKNATNNDWDKINNVLDTLAEIEKF